MHLILAMHYSLTSPVLFQLSRCPSVHLFVILDAIERVQARPDVPSAGSARLNNMESSQPACPVDLSTRPPAGAHVSLAHRGTSQQHSVPLAHQGARQVPDSPLAGDLETTLFPGNSGDDDYVFPVIELGCAKPQCKFSHQCYKCNSTKAHPIYAMVATHPKNVAVLTKTFLSQATTTNKMASTPINKKEKTLIFTYVAMIHSNEITWSTGLFLENIF